MEAIERDAQKFETELSGQSVAKEPAPLLCRLCFHSTEIEPFVTRICKCDEKSNPRHFPCIAEAIIDNNSPICPQCLHRFRDPRIEQLPESNPSLLELLSFPLSLQRVLIWATITLALGLLYNLSTVFLDSDSEILGLLRSSLVIFNGITAVSAVFSYLMNPSQHLRYIRVERLFNGAFVTTFLDTYVWHWNPKPDERLLKASYHDLVSEKEDRSKSGVKRCTVCYGSDANQPLVSACRCPELVFHQSCLLAIIVETFDQKCSKCDTFYNSDRIRREPSFWHFVHKSRLGLPLLFIRIVETISFCMDLDDLLFNSHRSYGFARKSMPILGLQLIAEALGWLYLWLYGYPEWYASQRQKKIVYRSDKEVHKIILIDTTNRDDSKCDE